jgi:transcriptional regulator with XRE-family HTH domain
MGLKEMRERRGLSQSDLAVGAGVGKSTIAKIEAGRVRPHHKTVRKLAKALRVSPAELRAAIEHGNNAVLPHGAPTLTSEQLAERGREGVCSVDGVKAPTEGSGLGSESDHTCGKSRREEVLELARAWAVHVLSDSQIGLDELEALLFTGLVTYFRHAAFDLHLRPELFQGRVLTIQRALEQAELIGRAMMTEDYTNTVRLELRPGGAERVALVKAIARWEETHRPVLREWAGTWPAWDDGDFTHLVPEATEQDVLSDEATGGA